MVDIVARNVHQASARSAKRGLAQDQYPIEWDGVSPKLLHLLEDEDHVGSGADPESAESARVISPRVQNKVRTIFK